MYCPKEIAVDQITLHAKVGEALTVMAEALEPFIADTVAARLDTSEVPWTAILQKLDQDRGRGFGAYSVNDPSLQLRALTERLGTLGFPFDNVLPRVGKAYASELRQVRNLWAHNEPFTPQSAFRAIDTALQLVDLISAPAEAEKLRALKDEVLPVRPLDAPAQDAPATNDAPKSDAPSKPEPASAVPSAQVEMPGDASNVAVESAQEDSAPPRPAETARVDIAATSFLSYAMAHARIGVVDEIVIENLGPEARAATIEVDVVSSAGSLGGPKVLIADLAESVERASRTTTLHDIDLTLDPAGMLQINTQQPGQIRVTVRDASGVLLGSAERDVQVLAHNRWIANPIQLGLELLAAHVQPNAAAISSLLSDAADRLKTSTGSSSLDAYQSGSPERVDSIVAAIFDAARARDIRYAEPPASWGPTGGLGGQKIRTPEEVLVGRLGTCLDTAAMLAAALEQAGINPTIWVAEGHAFLGYWRVDSSLGEAATTTVDDVINRVELGQLGVLETTMVTGGAESATFAAASRSPFPSYIEAGSDRILGVVDVRQARQSSIFPLPSSTTDAAGNVIVKTYEAAQRAAILPYQYTGLTHGDTTADVPPRVTQWKNSLLDLSLRNKLINYTDRAGYSLVVPSTAIGRFEDQVNAGETITLLPSDRVQEIDRARGIRFARDLNEDVRAERLAEKREAHIEVTEASYTSKLRYLAYKAKTIIEETGANNLYLAFGMLHWKAGDRTVRSPLVLVPVTLKAPSRNGWYKIEIDEAGSSTPNYCLIERLRTEHHLDVPELMNPTEDASGIDLKGTFDSVRAAIVRAGLPFRVEETVDLAILQFAKFRLWKDLDDNWASLAGNSLVKHLIEKPTQLFEDPVGQDANEDLDAIGADLPVSADSSQIEAVAAAVAGNTFVLEGPPGTGKSQTITNLLARALAGGKRVLFVAEKRAALNVVKERLEAVGFGAFSLDLHDKGARPAAVRAQIKTALDLHVQADTDALASDREIVAASRNTLARYADRLHETNAMGHSMYSARTAFLATDASVPALEIPIAFVAGTSDDTVQSVRSALRELPALADLAKPSARHPWGFADDHLDARTDADGLVAAAVSFDGALESAVAAGLDIDVLERAFAAIAEGEESGNPNDAAAVSDWISLVDAPRFDLASLDTLASPQWRDFLGRSQASLAQLVHNVPAWIKTVRPEALGRDVASLNADAVAADNSAFFGRKKRRRAVLARIADLLVVDQATVDLKTLSTLTQSLVETQKMISDFTASLQQVPIAGVPTAFNPYLPGQADALNARLGWLLWLANELGAAPTPVQLVMEQPSGDDLRVQRRDDLRHYYASTAAGTQKSEISTFVQASTAIVSFLAPDQLTEWAHGQPLHLWRETRPVRRLENSMQASRWLDFVRGLDDLRAHGLFAARSALMFGAVGADDAVMAFDKGAAQASLEERGMASGLAEFDPAAHLKTIDRFERSSSAVRAELPTAIPADVLAQRKFNADAGSGQIGLLRRQLDRQRGGMSVRALLDNFGELITQLMPCTLMSPESVARFFPARHGVFDLVVFDEASQIRVADAVGAMGRAHSAVIVGDSKQMPPTSVAEVTSGVDDEDESPDVVVDEESILSECAKAGVPSKWLSWHYRSQDESLILFSNQHYYESRLSSFPAPLHEKATTGSDGHGVSLVRVNGTFERSGRGKLLRTNGVEAQAIVDDVRRRFEASPETTPSLGIITFNAQQRDFIESLLRDSGVERIVRALDEPDGLFVKNLENVQGDERDSILFSVAFSANEKGVVPLNFGPLSRAGGERRLNVAITRARRQVVLYSSFDSDQLRTGETSSLGLKHLRAYLELAQRGAGSVAGAGGRRASIDRHRDEIAAELRMRGLAVATDVGLSEFRVDISIALESDPERPLIAVLLDGPAWRARRTVADRDGLPLDVLQGIMHWPDVERVWLPEWINDREAVLDRLEAAMKDAVTPGARSASVPSEAVSLPGDAGASTPAPVTLDSLAPDAGVDDRDRVRAVDDAKRAALLTSAPPPYPRPGEWDSAIARSHPAEAEVADDDEDDADEDKSDLYRGHPLVSQFEEWSGNIPASVDVLDKLPRPDSVRQVQQVIRDAVAVEGPMQQDRLARLVGAAFGLGRVSGSRSEAILRCVPAELKRPAESAFVWPETVDPSTWYQVRRVDSFEQRPVDQVSLVEIANAMRVAAEVSAGMDEESIKREALALFGGRRITGSIGARLDQALRVGLESGRLERLPSGVLVSVRLD